MGAARLLLCLTLSAAAEAADDGLARGRAAADRITLDPRGRLLLQRLAAEDGLFDPLPVLIGDLPGRAAEYDASLEAIVVDRDLPLDGGSADSVIVHEYVHAWQARREPVLRAMAQGGLPAAPILDYEVEAALTKNLFLFSRLSREPGCAVDALELLDFRRMAGSYHSWREELKAAYRARGGLELSELVDERPELLPYLLAQTARLSRLEAEAGRAVRAAPAILSARSANN